RHSGRGRRRHARDGRHRPGHHRPGRPVRPGCDGRRVDQAPRSVRALPGDRAPHGRTARHPCRTTVAPVGAGPDHGRGRPPRHHRRALLRPVARPRRGRGRHRRVAPAETADTGRRLTAMASDADPLRTSEEEFRAAAQAFLDANAKPRQTVEARWGQGSDRVGLFRESTPEEDAKELAQARDWRARCFDAGFIWASGPVEYGGRGLPRSFDRIWASLESGYDVPTGANLFLVGLGMVAPTTLAHGTEDAKQRYLRALWRSDLIGCQLFSEPEAGSDLANVKTRAVRDGDEWVVNGQKVWTSGAHYSDLGILLTRTSADPDNRHHGLTMFLVDMHSPGIEIGQLRQMTGGTSFYEVFLDDVRIADGQRLGDVDDGWRVALTTPMNERAAIGGGSASSGFSTTRRLFELAHHTGLNQDPVLRQRLAQLWIRSQITRYN